MVLDTREASPRATGQRSRATRAVIERLSRTSARGVGGLGWPAAPTRAGAPCRPSRRAHARADVPSERYGTFPALFGVSLECGGRKRSALIGPKGAERPPMTARRLRVIRRPRTSLVMEGVDLDDHAGHGSWSRRRPRPGKPAPLPRRPSRTILKMAVRAGSEREVRRQLEVSTSDVPRRRERRHQSRRMRAGQQMVRDRRG